MKETSILRQRTKTKPAASSFHSSASIMAPEFSPNAGQEINSPNTEFLPKQIQYQYEDAYGQDFSNVQLKKNSSEASNLGVKAFTQGNHIHLAPGQFKPEEKSGQKLLGHEISHVIQQKKGNVATEFQYGGYGINNDPQKEKEADLHGELASKGKNIGIQQSDSEKTQNSSQPIQAFGFGSLGKAIKKGFNKVSSVVSKGAGAVSKGISKVAGTVSKGVSKGANWLEKSLSKGISTGIGFLGKTLGLGGISNKIKTIIEKIRNPINKAILKAFGYGKLAGKKGISALLKLGDKGISMVEKILDFGQRVGSKGLSLIRKIGGKIGQGAKKGIGIVGGLLGKAKQGVINMVTPVIIPITKFVQKASSAIKDILMNPIGFMKNLLKALKNGFGQFTKNILKHLTSGLINWLMSNLANLGIKLPNVFNIKGILTIVKQIIKMTWKAIAKKILALLGPVVMKYGPEAAAVVHGIVKVGPKVIMQVFKRMTGVFTEVKSAGEQTMEKKDEMMDLMSNMMKAQHEMQMGAIENLK